MVDVGGVSEGRGAVCAPYASDIQTDLLESRPALPPAGAWPNDTTDLYLPRLSTRLTEVTWTPGTFSVKVFSLATDSDWDLALRIVGNVGRWAGTPIDCDVMGNMTADELRLNVPLDTWRRQAESGVRTVTALVKEGRGPIEIPGAVRPFHVGTRMLAALQGKDDGETVDRWIAAMLKVQYFGLDAPDEVFAGLFEADRPEGGDPFRFAIWTPNRVWAMPDVPFVAVSGDQNAGEDVFFIPASAVETLAEGHWQWLDEKQRVVFGFDDTRWPELRDRARRFATKP